MSRKTNKRPRPQVTRSKPKEQPRTYTGWIILVALISILLVFGIPFIYHHDNRRQLEKEFAYSFCGMKVIELKATRQSGAKYWYEEAKRIEPSIRNKDKIMGTKRQMEKAYWNEN